PRETLDTALEYAVPLHRDPGEGPLEGRLDQDARGLPLPIARLVGAQLDEPSLVFVQPGGRSILPHGGKVERARDAATGLIGRGHPQNVLSRLWDPQLAGADLPGARRAATIDEVAQG